MLSDLGVDFLSKYILWNIKHKWVNRILTVCKRLNRGFVREEFWDNFLQFSLKSICCDYSLNAPL